MSRKKRLLRVKERLRKFCKRMNRRYIFGKRFTNTLHIDYQGRDLPDYLWEWRSRQRRYRLRFYRELEGQWVNIAWRGIKDRWGSNRENFVVSRGSILGMRGGRVAARTATEAEAFMVADGLLEDIAREADAAIPPF